jgi:hypothetical protein
MLKVQITILSETPKGAGATALAGAQGQEPTVHLAWQHHTTSKDPGERPGQRLRAESRIGRASTGAGTSQHGRPRHMCCDRRHLPGWKGIASPTIVRLMGKIHITRRAYRWHGGHHGPQVCRGPAMDPGQPHLRATRLRALGITGHLGLIPSDATSNAWRPRRISALAR